MDDHEHWAFLDRGPLGELYCIRCKQLMKVIPLATLDVVEQLQSEKTALEQRLAEAERELQAAKVYGTNANTRNLDLQEQLAAAVQERDDYKARNKAEYYRNEDLSKLLSETAKLAQRYREALEAVNTLSGVDDCH